MVKKTIFPALPVDIFVRDWLTQHHYMNNLVNRYFTVQSPQLSRRLWAIQKRAAALNAEVGNVHLSTTIRLDERKWPHVYAMEAEVALREYAWTNAGAWWSPEMVLQRRPHSDDYVAGIASCTTTSATLGPGITFYVFSQTDGKIRVDMEWHDPAFAGCVDDIYYEWTPEERPKPSALEMTKDGLVEHYAKHPEDRPGGPERKLMETESDEVNHAMTDKEDDKLSVIRNASHREMLNLWSKGYSKPTIAKRLGKKAKTIENVISKVRSEHPDLKVPYKEGRPKPS